MMDTKIRLGISACLLGHNVRYDGGHQLDRFLRDTLGQFVEYVPVCPEVECGLPVPREAMRLVGDSARPRLVTVRTGRDLTERMETWARARLEALAREDLCGFVFKSGSPSSGMERVRVYDASGMPSKTGRGVFARMFIERFPLLPVEDEGRLHDPALRENFIERLFTLKRWRETVGAHPSRGALVAFHTRHKYLLQAHSVVHARDLSRLVAHAKDLPIADLCARYLEGLMAALRLRATIKKHANVLQHIMGYFKKSLSRDEKQELSDIIEQYRTGQVPLIVPVTLLNHYVRKYDQPYLKEQAYLCPHPAELGLRNHV